MSFIGIDIGTSFIKGAVLDVDALSINHIRRIAFPDPLPDLPPLYKEYDPYAVLSVVQRLLDDLLAYAEDCEGIAMCSQMHGLVFTTALGEPLSNLTTWQDQRVLLPHPSGKGTYFDVMRQRLSPDMLRKMGNELHAGQPLGVLFWRAEQGDLPGTNSIPTSLPDFVLANLCGTSPCTELTHAMSHGGLNLETLDWHQEVLSLLGVNGLHWPEIRPYGQVVGYLPSVSRTIPCYTPVGDYQCAMVGALLEPGELSFNISTGSQVSLLKQQLEFGNYQTRPFFDERFLATITHIPAGRALNMLVKLLSELAEMQELSLADPWPYIARKSAEVEKTKMRMNLSFYNSSFGDYGEISHILEEELTVGHLFHAAFQNMAENFYSCALRLSPAQAWDNLVFSGGLTQIDILRQLISTKFQKSYRMCPTSEDTLLGLLALALAFTGRAGSVDQATTMLREAYSQSASPSHSG